MGKYDKINDFNVKDLPDYVPHKIKMTAEEKIEIIKILIDKTKFKTNNIKLLRESIGEVLNNE